MTHPDEVPSLSSWEGVKYAFFNPIERNAWLRLPHARVPSTDGILGVSTANNGQRAWVTTTSGLMFRSDDAGNTWNLLPSDLPERPARAPVFLDSARGWVIAGRQLWMTLDGGSRWSPDTLAPSSATPPELPLALWGQENRVLCLTNRSIWAYASQPWAPIQGLYVADLMPELEDGSSMFAATDDLGFVLLSNSRGIRVLRPDRSPPSEAVQEKSAAFESAVIESTYSVHGGPPRPEIRAIRVGSDGRFYVLAREGVAVIDPAKRRWEWLAHVEPGQDAPASVRRWRWSFSEGVLRPTDFTVPTTGYPAARPALPFTTQQLLSQEGAGFALLGDGEETYADDSASTLWHTRRLTEEQPWVRSLVLQESFTRPVVDPRFGHLWMGSSAGTLLRSRDQGRHWDAEAVLGIAIQSIAFSPDGQTGSVRGSGAAFEFDPSQPRATLLPRPAATRPTGSRDADTASISERTRAPGCEDGDCREVSLVDGRGWALRTPERKSSRQQVDTREVVAFTQGDGTWTEQPLPERIDRLFAVGNGVGLAFSSQGTLFRTSNWGRTWERVEHATYPPLAYYVLAWPAVLGLVWWATRRPKLTTTAEVMLGSRLTSDRPLDRNGDDVLGLHEIALGLSRFLRNDQTEPSLTIAVTGRWGTGKSSMLNLLASDLGQYGVRPIRFNAWHNEQQGNPVASLYDAIIREGLPPLVSLDGLKFRARLLVKRGQRHRVKLIGSALVFLFAFTYFRFSPERFIDSLGVVTTTLAQVVKVLGTSSSESYNATPTASTLPDSVAQWFAVLVAVFSLINLTRTLLGRLQAFGVDPAKLLSSLQGSTKAGDTKESVGFHSRFAEEFREVTVALPYRLVLLVDDLDRCTPANTLKMLEAINFLTSSGDCFVVMAVSSEVLRAYVSAALKDAPPIQEGTDNPQRDTANVYLEKLINLEVKVPAMTEAHAVRLTSPALDDDASKERHEKLQATERGRRAVVLARRAQAWGAFGFGALLCVLLAWMVRPAQQVRSPEVRPTALAADARAAAPASSREKDQRPTGTAAPPVQSTTAPPASGAGTKGVTSGPPSSATPKESPPANNTAPSDERTLAERPARGADEVALVQQVPEDPLTARWVGPVLLVGGVALLLAALARRSGNVVVKDSVSFQHALAAWMPLLTRLHPTPRALKRFLNRLRYYAMRQGSSEDDEEGPLVAFVHGWLDAQARGVSRLARLKAAGRRMRRGGEAPSTSKPTGEDTIPDSWLVALASAADWEQVKGQDLIAVLLEVPSFSARSATETLAQNIHQGAAKSPIPAAELLNQVARPDRISKETHETWMKTKFDPVDDPRAVVLAFERLQRKTGELQAGR